MCAECTVTINHFARHLNLAFLKQPSFIKQPAFLVAVYSTFLIQSLLAVCFLPPCMFQPEWLDPPAKDAGAAAFQYPVAEKRDQQRMFIFGGAGEPGLAATEQGIGYV